MKLARERTELLSRVKWFMLLRLILISVLMPVSAWVFGQGATPSSSSSGCSTAPRSSTSSF